MAQNASKQGKFDSFAAECSYFALYVGVGVSKRFPSFFRLLLRKSRVLAAPFFCVSFVLHVPLGAYHPAPSYKFREEKNNTNINFSVRLGSYV